MTTQKFGQESLARQLHISSRRDVDLISVLLLAMFAAFVAYVARLNPVTHDAFHEMALVREWFRTGAFPTSDVWSYSPTVSPAVHHEWATGLALYWSSGDNPLGLQGMMALRFSLICLLWIILYRVARNGGCHPIVFAVLAPITFPFLWVGFSTVRAQLFTLVFLAIQMLFLQADWRGRKAWVFAWLLLFVAWLNMHAGFVVGAAYLISHIAEKVLASLHDDGVLDAKRPWVIRFGKFGIPNLSKAIGQTWHLMALIPIGIGLAFLNPWGSEYIPYLFRAITMPRPTIVEWQPLWRTYAPDITMAAYGVAVAIMIYAACQRRWVRLRGWMFCALAAYMALKHIRHGSLFAVLWIGIVPALVSSTPLGRWIVQTVQSCRRKSIIAASVTTMACGVFAMVQPFWLATIPQSTADINVCYPVGAVNYLKQNAFEGNVMTPFQSGAYVSWRLYPEVLVSLDGRYEVAYQDHVLPDHNYIYQAKPGWQERVTKYPSDLIMVNRVDPLAKALLMACQSQQSGANQTESENSPEWQLYYEDDAFLLFGQPGLDLKYTNGQGRVSDQVF
jgi:hypothetical protein